MDPNRLIILHDDPALCARLLPLTFTRPISRLLLGMTTLARKWEDAMAGKYSCSSAEWLSELYPTDDTPGIDTITIDSATLPDEALVEAIESLAPGEALASGDVVLAKRCRPECEPTSVRTYEGAITRIAHTYDLFLLNDAVLRSDFERLCRGRVSAPLSATNTLIGSPDDIFIEPGATVEGATINCSRGPVYIGRDAEVMEGVCIRGPLALMEGSTINMGAKIYGATTIGPHSKVGGEVNNVVIIGYSNKAHDGFLGNAVIGEWCNLGAGCTASNLKNDYAEVKLWDYPSRRFLRTGLQFCGLIMGDHSKAGINTMFNTGTVVGVGVNVHGSGYPRNFMASFTEGSTAGYTDVSLNRFFATAEKVMARRGIALTPAYRRMIERLETITESYR